MAHHIDHHDYIAPAQRPAGGRDMDNPTTKPRRRRLLSAAATVAAGALMASSAAWACTLREGTVEIYSTAFSSCDQADSLCSKVTDTAAQTGLAVVLPTGTEVKLNGSDLASATFDVNWRHPGSTANCHRQTTADTQVIDWGADVTGPSFSVTRTTPSTVGRILPTGLARICLQEEEFDGSSTVISGQVIDVSVVL